MLCLVCKTYKALAIFHEKQRQRRLQGGARAWAQTGTGLHSWPVSCVALSRCEGPQHASVVGLSLWASGAGVQGSDLQA